MNKTYILIMALTLAGCGDPFYDQYVTDSKLTTTGKFFISKIELIDADKPRNGESELEINNETITFKHFPIYEFGGKITKYYDGVLPNVICNNGSKSNGDIIFGFQNGSNGPIFNYLKNGDISIGIGDPDTGERVVYSRIIQPAQQGDAPEPASPAR